MGKVHLRETELACLSDGEPDVEMAEHLRWCARCRSIATDYRWLQGEIKATLAAVADAVAVPGPKWRVVQERMSASQRRRVAVPRVSAVASVVSAVCLMLSVSPVLGTAAIAQTARTLPPEPIVAPAPAMAVVSSEPGEHLALMATPTPDISHEEAALALTPAVMLPPTPLER